MSHSKALPYLLLLPAAVLLLAVVLYPMVYGVTLALTDRTLLTFHPNYVGLDNFKAMLQDDRFMHAARNSVSWSVLTVVGTMLSGFALALILNKQFFGQRFARGILLVPWTIPSVALAFVWIWLYDPLLGVFNQIIQLLGGTRIEFLSNMKMTQVWVAVAVIWRYYPFVMLMLLAGLQAIDRELYEAAAVDGANAWQKFWSITVPGIRAIFGLVTVLEFIWLFNHIDVIWIMTGGGPADVSHTLATYAYYVGFREFQYAYAAAIGVVMMVILAISALVYLHMQERVEVEL